MPRDRTLPPEPPRDRPAPGLPAPRGWVLVPADEPGLLHRVRRVVQNSQDLVLVRLEPRAATPAGASLGVGLEFAWSTPRLGRLTWFGDLSAADVGLVEQWLAGPAPNLAHPPAALHHRIAAAPRGATRAGP